MTAESSQISDVNIDLYMEGEKGNKKDQLVNNHTKARIQDMSNISRGNKTKSTLHFVLTNGSGLIGGKVSSLKPQVNLTKTNVVTLQKTHVRRKGRIQISEMVVFEAIRKD